MRLTRSRRAITATLVAATALVAITSTTAAASPPSASSGPPPGVPAPIYNPPPPVLNPDGSLPGLVPDPVKSRLPRTDLRNYPKLPPGEVERAAVAEALTHYDDDGVGHADESTETVVLEERLPDGSVGVSIFEPAVGVTPRQLADTLRANGVPADVRKGDLTMTQLAPGGERSGLAVAAIDPNRCSYTTSVAVNNDPSYSGTVACPNPGHWTNNGFEDPLVRFNDLTPAGYPVSSAVYSWNQTANIDSEYRYNSCPFQAGARCVTVSTGAFGDTGWFGRSYVRWASDGSGRFQESNASIVFNTSYNLTSQQRSTLVCHELGHGLGLGHGTSSTSCMDGPNDGDRSTSPNSSNRTFLSGLYSITR